MKFRTIMALSLAASLIISYGPTGFAGTDAVYGIEKAAANVHSDSGDDVGGSKQYLSSIERTMALKHNHFIIYRYVKT